MKRYALIFLAAYFWAVLQPSVGLDGNGFGRGFESVSVARSIVSTGQFRDPFCLPTGPTAHLAPIYPALLAAIFAGFGYSSSAIVVLIILNALALAASAVLVMSISQKLYGGSAAGVVAAVLLLVSSRVSVQSEAFCALALMISAAAAILVGSPTRASLLAGVSFLANPSSILSLPVILICRGRRFLAIVLLCALSICMPWIVRNWIVLGSPYLVRDNLGIELYISNGDSASPELVTNPLLRSEHPTANPEEAERVALYGESSYNRIRLKDAVRWIVSHPGRFGSLSAQRILYYWLPSTREGWQALGYWGITILAIAGMWIGPQTPSTRLFFLAGLAYSIPYSLVQADVRYRFPSLWIQALPAGYAFVEIARMASRRIMQHAPVPRKTFLGRQTSE